MRTIPIRVSFNDPEAKGWLLIRMSLHDPLLPLNIEADNEGGAKNMQKRMLEFLNNYEYVDTSMLS